MFDYTSALRGVCRDICAKTPIFQRYDLDYVGFAFRTSRNDSMSGVFASLTPLRFEGGATATFRRGAFWKAPDVFDASGRFKLLYILTIYAPRFLNLSLKDKIETLTHELYHISPAFDGDLRRFQGRKYAHGASRKSYDAVVAERADAWLATDPSPQIWGFLSCDAAELTRRFGKIGGWRFPSIPLRRVSEAEALRLNPRLAGAKK